MGRAGFAVVAALVAGGLGWATAAALRLEREQLEQRAEAEHAAQTAHLELRRLYGRQAEAFTWTLPLGRGLA